MGTRDWVSLLPLVSQVTLSSDELCQRLADKLVEATNDISKLSRLYECEHESYLVAAIDTPLPDLKPLMTCADSAVMVGAAHVVGKSFAARA